MRVVRVSVVSLLLWGCLVLANGCTSAGRGGPVASQDNKLQQQGTKPENLLSKRQERIEQIEKRVKAVETELRKLEEEISALKIIISTEVKIKEKLFKIVVGDKTEIVAEISPASAVPLVSFEIEDSNIATVEPRSASSSPQILQVTGVKGGKTHLIVRVDGHLCAKTAIKIRPSGLLTKAESILKSRFGLTSLVLATMVLLLLGYVIYGRFLVKLYGLEDSGPTPSHTHYDGVDYVPARAPLLLGQHFSAIAAAGPIVGPILAGIWFGWLPAILWIIVGAIFIGGVHDYLSLLGSVRHKAASIGEIVLRYMSPGTRIFFMLFVWLALLYVIIAFTDITAQTFCAVSHDMAFGPAVAASSIIYLGLAIVMGVLLYRFKLKLWLLTLVFLPLVLLAVWVGPHLPQQVLDFLGSISAKQWGVFLLVYCFVASIIPMWLLLQPRGYLGGWLLYLTIIIGLCGALFGGFKIEYPALNLSGLHSIANGKLLFPFLFITIACGACSGFHAIVSSGTTSKQLNKESDAYCIGYGAMLLEGLVAVLALATVMMLPKGSPQLENDPNLIYANGLASYLGLLGVGFNVAFPFALLAFSTFVYDTLDVSTRLARYIFQELMGWQSFASGCAATLISLVIPLAFLLSTEEKSYLVAWPIFGTSNQMLASLTLLALSAWLAKSGKRIFYVVIPMIFMMAMTIVALILQIKPFIAGLPDILRGVEVKGDVIISGVCGIILLILSGSLIFISAGIMLRRTTPQHP